MDTLTHTAAAVLMVVEEVIAGRVRETEETTRVQEQVQPESRQNLCCLDGRQDMTAKSNEDWGWLLRWFLLLQYIQIFMRSR